MPLHSHPPQQLFFRTAEQRIALAREQFFEEGLRPSGLVGEAVIQSWTRCSALRLQAKRSVVFNPVTPSRLHATLGRNRTLIEASQQELKGMEASLAGTECRLLLTDRDGVIVHATHNPLAAHSPVLNQVARVGINISETAIGTSAPGIVAKTGQACTVSGAEHFFEVVHSVQCAAAPIRDIHGQLAGVLDLSIESASFGFDAASMVGLYATSIENRLMRVQSTNHVVIQFQSDPSLIHTPLQGLGGVSGDGRIAWLNGIGARLVGQQPGTPPQMAEDVIGLNLQTLLSLTTFSAPIELRLPNGLGIWLRAVLQAPDGATRPTSVAARPTPVSPAARAPVDHGLPAMGQPLPALVPDDPDDGEGVATPATPTTLTAHRRALMEKTLAACGGNVSKAARQLGVSRGTLYRQLQRQPSSASNDESNRPAALAGRA